MSFETLHLLNGRACPPNLLKYNIAFYCAIFATSENFLKIGYHYILTRRYLDDKLILQPSKITILKLLTTF
jgi:hypothetical protein